MKYLVFGFGLAACLLVVLFLIDDGERKSDPGTEMNDLPISASVENGLEHDREPFLPGSLDGPSEENSGEAEPAFEPLQHPGWQVWGMVTDEQGNPIPGANVSLNYYLDFEITGPAISTTTDDSGRYTLNVGLSEEMFSTMPMKDSYPGSIEGRAWAFGFLPVRIWQPPDGVHLSSSFDQHDPIRLDFTLKAGAVVHGRVIDSRGRPVLRAAVNLVPDGGKKRDTKYTDYQGAYRIPITTGGPHYLTAGKFGRGSARCENIELHPGRDLAVPDLLLQGAGELEGRAVYPNGNPAKELDLYAYSEQFIGKVPGRFSVNEPEMYSADGTGLLINRTVTEEDGSFTFSGLKAGRYFIGLGYSQMMRIKAPELFETGRRDILLVVDVYRLKVILKDGKDHLMPSASLSINSDSGLTGTWVEGGRSEWEIIAPGSVSVSAKFRHRTAGMELEIPKEQYETVVELGLGEPEETGTVLLHVTGCNDEPVTRITALIMPLEVTNSRTLAMKELEDSEGKYRIPTIPGLYGISLREKTVPGTGGYYLSWFVNSVEVIAQRDIPVRVKMIQGGYLKVTVHISEADATRILVNGRLMDSTDRLAFCIVEGEQYTERQGIVPNIPNLTGKPMNPGSYTLLLECDGFDTTEVTFDILTGQITEREVRLYPK